MSSPRHLPTLEAAAPRSPSGRGAYLLGLDPKPDLLAAIEAGHYPRTEYYLFQQQGRLDVLSLANGRQSRNSLPRLLNRIGGPFWGLPAVALTDGSRYASILTSGEDVGVRLSLLAKLCGARVPIRITAHGPFFASRKFRMAMAVLRRMDNVHFLGVSAAVCRTLRRTFGVPPARVHNTSYGVDTRFFHPMTTERSRPLIVGAGMNGRDYRTLVRAVAPLGVEVRIAADSAWHPKRLDIEGDRLPANVNIRAYDHVALRDLYAQATVIAVPLYPVTYGCGNAVITQAMAMGKPVITSRIEGRGDFVVDGETGYYVEPGDTEGLRERIAHLLGNEREARRLGENARARTEAWFSLERYCARLENVLELEA